MRPQKTPHSPSEPAPQPTESELYAASAAENAIHDTKSVSDENTDLSDLATAVQSTSVSTENTPPVDNPQHTRNDPDDAPERVLTKEEMVEEALNCPCIAAMRDGPCGDSFIAAYRCFLESETEPKGMDCMQQFTGMQGCMADHPEEYNMDDDDDDPFAVTDDNPDREEKVADKSNASNHNEHAQGEPPLTTSSS